ncbi:MAG TPA: DDE-type integrase/transposase/recombinase [Anaeromyxobacteraceae bacterium]|nr:DDE-type integrase/transposase/recombinase [Anaeromyxobacteraceae bacterium]
MRRAGLQGLSGRPRYRHIPNVPTAADHVQRQFQRAAPDQLWVTDIPEHPTREGKVYCAVVLDVFSRRMVGWSIDAALTAALVTNALGMAIDHRAPTKSTWRSSTIENVATRCSTCSAQSTSRRDMLPRRQHEKSGYPTPRNSGQVRVSDCDSALDRDPDRRPIVTLIDLRGSQLRRPVS